MATSTFTQLQSSELDVMDTWYLTSTETARLTSELRSRVKVEVNVLGSCP